MQSNEVGHRVEPLTRFNTWPLAGSICILVLTLLPFVFYGTSSALFSVWNNATTYNYCFLIVPICAWLIWERREALLAAAPRPNPAGFGLLFAAGAIWLLGQLSGAVLVSELALVAMAQSTIVAILGTQATRAIAFPFVYLIFLVPAGDSLIPPLQTVTATFTVTLLKIAGIPVRSDGLMIYLPNSTWLVAEACAGVKFLIASVALGALLSGMFLRRWRRRMFFMALSVAVPIVANGFRAFIIVVIGYLTNRKYAVGADHILYGWVLFALVLAGMIGIAVALRDTDDLRPAHRQIPARLHAAASARLSASAALCCLLLVVSFRVGAFAAEAPANLGIPNALPLLVQQPWREIEAQDPSPPVFSGADRVWHRAYSDGAAPVYLTIGYFAWERPGAEAASSIHRFTSATGAIQTGERFQETNIAQTMLGVSTLTFAAGHDRRLVWHWLWVDDSYVGNPYVAKLLQLIVKLFGGTPAAAIVSVSTDYKGSEDSAEATLRRFVRSMGRINPATSTSE